jgi:putative transposase
MNNWQSHAQVKRGCKYHVVILPKYRRKVLYGRKRRGIGQILRDLCCQKDIELAPSSENRLGRHKRTDQSLCHPVISGRESPCA